MRPGPHGAARPAAADRGRPLGGTAQAAIWIVALAIDFAGPFVFGVRGFQVSAGHFAERFGLIVIIALGESIVAIGAGLRAWTSTRVSSAAALGRSCSLRALVGVLRLGRARRREPLPRARGDEQAVIARDSYSYLHLPMIAGIVLFALGVKKTIGDVDEPLKTVPAVALFGGIALYFAGHVGSGSATSAR